MQLLRLFESQGRLVLYDSSTVNLCLSHRGDALNGRAACRLGRRRLGRRCLGREVLVTIVRFVRALIPALGRVTKHRVSR